MITAKKKVPTRDLIPLWVAIIAGVFTLTNTIVDRIDFNKIIIASIQQPRAMVLRSTNPTSSTPTVEGFNIQKLPEQPAIVTVLKWFQDPIVRYSIIGTLFLSLSFFVIRLIIRKQNENKEKK